MEENTKNESDRMEENETLHPDGKEEEGICGDPCHWNSL